MCPALMSGLSHAAGLYGSSGTGSISLPAKPKLEQPVQEEQIRAPLDQHWAASDANDFETEHRIYLRRGTGASWKWPRRVMSRSVGRAEPVFVTTVRPGLVSRGSRLRTGATRQVG